MKKIGRIKYVTRGVYDPDTTYREMDVVLFEGSLWEPKKETTGNPPPDHQRNEDGTPASNEFWKLFLPGALGDDYVKKTDLAVQKTETSAGKPGISYPDGKTIFADENGMLTGATAGKRLTQEEMNEQLTSGELETGNVVYLTGPAEGTGGLVVKVDAELNADSVHAIRNSAVTNAINAANALIAENQRLIAETKALRATLESFGLSKICPVGVTDATEANGMVLGAFEKNASVEGSLSNKISKKSTEINTALNFVPLMVSGEAIDGNWVVGKTYTASESFINFRIFQATVLYSEAFLTKESYIDSENNILRFLTTAVIKDDNRIDLYGVDIIYQKNALTFRIDSAYIARMRNNAQIELNIIPQGETIYGFGLYGVLRRFI